MHVTGDERINQNPELLMVDVVFIKLHNLVAIGLQAVNPKWNDERLFKEARRICIAIYQHIIASEYLPVLLGNYKRKIIITNKEDIRTIHPVPYFPVGTLRHQHQLTVL